MECLNSFGLCYCKICLNKLLGKFKIDSIKYKLIYILCPKGCVMKLKVRIFLVKHIQNSK